MTLLTKAEFIRHLRNAKLADRDFVVAACRQIAFDHNNLARMTSLALGDLRPTTYGQWIRDQVYLMAEQFAQERWEYSNGGDDGAE